LFIAVAGLLHSGVSHVGCWLHRLRAKLRSSQKVGGPDPITSLYCSSTPASHASHLGKSSFLHRCCAFSWVQTPGSSSSL